MQLVSALVFEAHLWTIENRVQGRFIFSCYILWCSIWFFTFLLAAVGYHSNVSWGWAFHLSHVATWKKWDITCFLLYTRSFCIMQWVPRILGKQWPPNRTFNVHNIHICMWWQQSGWCKDGHAKIWWIVAFVGYASPTCSFNFSERLRSECRTCICSCTSPTASRR